MTTTTIRLKRVHVEKPAEVCDSLVAALRGMFGAFGRDVSYETLSAATGCGFMTSFAEQAPARQQWNVYGRHAYVEPAVRLFGMTLRPLHPPAAAPLPEQPVEYDRHFHDSYLPFVAAALERDEPVLAWMGWPAPLAHLWGVVTQIDSHTGQCVGTTAYDAAQAEVMTRAPVQVYAVQDYTETEPRPDTLLSAALTHAADVLHDRLDPALGVVTGVAALERWRDHMGRHDLAVDRRNLDQFLCDRIFMLRFFDAVAPRAEAANANLAKSCVAVIEKMVERLRRCRHEAFETQRSETEAQRRLLEAVGETIDLERELAETISR